MKLKAQPWLASPGKDLLFIIGPPFLILLLIILFPDFFSEQKNDLIPWIILILLIDVSHVYTTLFRTYFDKDTFEKRRTLLINAPLFSLVCGLVLYSISATLFWRVMAYLAVFHFIRQQYGFMRLYSRKESAQWKFIDALAIYSATIYPIIYWHFSTDRSFNWFIEGDFFKYDSPVLRNILSVLYGFILITYLIKEISANSKGMSFNLPKNLIILGTTLSWYFGIIHFNGDLIFTSLNVVAHGIPYMALTYFYGKKVTKEVKLSSHILNLVYLKKFGVIAFIVIIAVLAFVEEGLWDALVWKERSALFSSFYILPPAEGTIKNIIIPLLSVPQITHYILDGFIWRMKKGDIREIQ